MLEFVMENGGVTFPVVAPTPIPPTPTPMPPTVASMRGRPMGFLITRRPTPIRKSRDAARSRNTRRHHRNHSGNPTARSDAPPLDDASLLVTAMATDHIFAQASRRAHEIRAGIQ